MKNIFNPDVVKEVIARIDELNPNSRPGWGKMTVSQMLAHCSVAYELVYENKHPKPNAFMKFILRAFVKNMVVGPKPYKKNGPTAPAFIMKDDKNFDSERVRLVNYIMKTFELGESFFDNKESHSFGRLTSGEWNTMFYKHLDHHLTQFGV